MHSEPPRHKGRGMTDAVKRRRGVAVRCAVFACAVVLGVCIAEVGVRLVCPVSDIVWAGWDPLLGARPAPNQRGRYVSGGFIRSSFAFNSQGWSSLEDYSNRRREGVLRVAVLGDSYVEALQVHPDQSFLRVAERHWAGEDVKSEWYGFGISGFGTSRHYLITKHHLADYSPDVVVLHFVTNDPLDCSPYLSELEAYVPRVELTEDEGDVAVSYPMPYHRGVLKPLVASSALVRYLDYQLDVTGRRGRNRRNQAAESLRGGMEQVQGADPESKRKTWKLIRVLLRKIQRLTRGMGAQLVVAFRGAPAALAAKRVGKPLQLPPKDVDPYCLGVRMAAMGDEMLRPICTELGVAYLDLSECLIAAEAEGGRHDFPDDLHYSALGHEVVGKELSRVVRVALEEAQEWPR